MPYQRMTVVWIWLLGFLTLIATLNAFYGAYKAMSEGGVFHPYLLGEVIGNVSTIGYFWLSVLLTLICFGGTVFMAIRYTSGIEDPLFDSLLAINQRAIALTTETLTQVHDTMGVEQQRNITRFDAVSNELEQLRKEVFATLQRQAAYIQFFANKIKPDIALPDPLVTAQSTPNEVKSIGPRITEELAAIGITTVHELLLASHITLVEHTNLSKRQVERISRHIPLLMVPGIDYKDIALLEQLGVLNRRELADQDPLELYQMFLELVDSLAEEKLPGHIEQPTFKEMLCWIQFAKEECSY